MSDKTRPRIDAQAAEALAELVEITGQTRERAASDAIREALAKAKRRGK
jgi:hypothetical protein